MSEMGKKLAAEIAARGPIPFSRFMELALYCPVCGYYEAEADKIGRRGDFYTSGSVGRVWGEMLAWEFSRWLLEWQAVERQRMGGDWKWQWVEAGAHRGDTARDILNWVQTNRPGVYDRLEFGIIEPSSERRRWQLETLAAHAEVVRWYETLAQVRRTGGGGVRGVVFSNELLDAMPVERLGWNAATGRWFRWGVGVRGDRFVWEKLDLGTEPTPVLPPGLLEVLPDEFTVEVCVNAERWWAEAAEALEFGRLLTFDYGYTREEMLAPERVHGTLRAYRAHQVSTDVLANPGEQDITAHVNFSAIREAGEAAGLRTVLFQNQADFLTGIAARLTNSGTGAAWPANWTRPFQTLTHPEHLGRAFRVLVQERM